MRRTILLLTMVLTICLCTTAAAYSETSPILVTAAPAVFAVTVPTTLPVTFASDGVLSVSDEAYIVNNSAGPICIAGQEIDTATQGGWTLVDWDEYPLYSYTSKDKLLAMDVLIDQITIPGKGGKVAVVYNARMPIDATDTSVLGNVVFTITWDSE